MNKLFPLHIALRPGLLLMLAFIATTITGTILHECGHYLAARSIGLEASIHYAYTSYSAPEHFHRQSHFIQAIPMLGGPLQTMGTGLIGFILVYYDQRKSKNRYPLQFKQWVYVFLALFWLRQSANGLLWMAGKFYGKNIQKNADEVLLAQHFGLPDWGILVPAALTGLFISLYVIFRYIPFKQRTTFILAGLCGGILGYYLWMEVIGSSILP